VSDMRTSNNLHFTNVVEAHQLLRSPAVTKSQLMRTSGERFRGLFKSYLENHDISPIRVQLQALLNPRPQNVALVVTQGVYAFFARWNAERILARIRKAPEEWIEFVVAEDDYVLIGSP
jgi:hypothetical protein